MPVKKEPAKQETRAEQPSEKAPVYSASFSPVSVAPKKDMLVPLLVGLIVVAAFGVGFLYGKVSVYEKIGTGGGTQAQQAGQPAQQAAPEAPVTVSIDKVKELVADKKNIVFGDKNKKLLFVEFSDASCPYCHIASGKNPELNAQVGDRFKLVESGGTYLAPVPEMKKLVEQGKAAYVWMYSPGHGNGELAAQAFYCAHEQGKFWPVHDLLMSNKAYDLLNETVQNDVKKIPELVSFVGNAVKSQDFQKCLESGKYADRVKTDEAVSRQFGVQGTPSFFVNEKNFGGAYSFTDMQSDVDAALK